MLPGIYRLRIKASEPQAPNGPCEIALRDMEDPPPSGTGTCRGRSGVRARNGLIPAGHSAGDAQALDYFFQSVATLARGGGSRRGCEDALHRWLDLHRDRESTKALAQSTQALALAQACDDLRAEARALNAIGSAQLFRGQEEAVGYYEQALPLMRISGDHAGGGNAEQSGGGICPYW
jgi:hypothetical protein